MVMPVVLLTPRSSSHPSLPRPLCEADLREPHHPGALAGWDGFRPWETTGRRWMAGGGGSCSPGPRSLLVRASWRQLPLGGAPPGSCSPWTSQPRGGNTPPPRASPDCHSPGLQATASLNLTHTSDNSPFLKPW